jgi:long-chain acyl-CoA synthetase
MGGEIRWMISGSAATPTWLLEFFHSIGLLLLEAYGISENPVPIAANRCDAFRFGSVGKPFALNQIRLADGGEVLVKGPAMFRGYLVDGRRDDRYTPDGYYRTGDYGRLDSDGFLYLTGRADELIKTSTGRRVSPVAVEAVYARSRYVDQIIVVGNDRPHLCALVVVNRDSVGASRSVMDLLRTDFTLLGAQLAPHEQIRAFVVLSSPFSVENGELTLTLKPRRARIEANHREVIDAMYDNNRDRTSELPMCRTELAGERA